MKSKLILLALCLSLGLGSSAQAGRAFVASNLDGLVLASAPASDVPLTMVGWFEANNITASHRIMWTNDGTSDNYTGLIAFGAGAGDKLAVYHRGAAGTQTNADSAAYVANTWTHAAGVFNSTTDRTAYKDGASAVQDTTSTGALTIDQIEVGAFVATGTHYLDGTLGPQTVFDSALTAAQIASLGAGRNPNTMATMPVFHMPMTGGLQEIIGGVSLTDTNGTTEAGHKPLGWN